MQDRLLNCHLSGAIEESTFTAKTAELTGELAEVDESPEKTESFDPDAPLRALAVFEFSQKVAELWHRSNFEEKREILECVSSNRVISHASLCLEKRKPFGFLAERPFLNSGRGDPTGSSRVIEPVELVVKLEGWNRRGARTCA